MRRLVHAEVRVPGLHCWPEAAREMPPVCYLANPHRHLFVIRATKRVGGDNREIEFILLAQDVRHELMRRYGPPRLADGSMEFGAASCEQLAEVLVDALDLEACTVLEDGENGATVERGR